MKVLTPSGPLWICDFCGMSALDTAITILMNVNTGGAICEECVKNAVETCEAKAKEAKAGVST